MTAAGVSTNEGVEPWEQRKTWIVTSAKDVATQGGYTAVTMREVARRAGVSTATLYRYFPSKHHLLVAVLIDWLDHFDEKFDVAAAGLRDPFDRLWFAIDALYGAFSSTPLLAEAMARAYVAADASAGPETDIARARLSEVLAEALGNSRPDHHHLAIGELLSDVWAANVLAVANGRTSGEAVRTQLRRIVDLLARREPVQGCPDRHPTDWPRHALP